jgi:hypothetical protein
MDGSEGISRPEATCASIRRQTRDGVSSMCAMVAPWWLSVYSAASLIVGGSGSVYSSIEQVVGDEAGVGGIKAPPQTGTTTSTSE